jgi:hypothetical protein
MVAEERVEQLRTTTLSHPGVEHVAACQPTAATGVLAGLLWARWHGENFWPSFTRLTPSDLLTQDMTKTFPGVDSLKILRRIISGKFLVMRDATRQSTEEDIYGTHRTRSLITAVEAQWAGVMFAVGAQGFPVCSLRLEISGVWRLCWRHG